MRRATPLPDHLAGSPFTVAMSDAAGVSRDRLEASDLTHPFRGVHVPRALLDAATDDERFAILCDAYQAKMPKGWFFSGPTAARIIGIPLPRRLESHAKLHVTSNGAFAPTGKQVIGHTAPGAQRTILFDRPVRVAAELWCELATVLEVDEIIAAGDRMLSDKPVLLAARHHLERAVGAYGSRRGVRKLREALPQLRDRVWSPRETWVRLVLLRAGLPEPERNVRLYRPGGGFVACGDLVYRRWRVVIEYEGERWHSDPWLAREVDRYNALVLAGWAVVRVRKNRSAAEVERMTRQALTLRGWRA